jgi:hypothetical protein
LAKHPKTPKPQIICILTVQASEAREEAAEGLVSGED